VKRSLFGAVALAAIALSVVLIGSASAAKPPTVASGCPAGGTFLADPNVGASASGGTTQTYTFNSWVDEHPVGGIPGLVSYCVIANQTPTTVTPTAHGDNGQAWQASKANQTFAFSRPAGDKSNIGLDGTDTAMGSAAFSIAPTSQTFLLHVNDSTTCQSLYGAGSSPSCFVKPSPRPGSCNTGDSSVAYNAMPSDVVNCVNPGIGFEATSTSEFGNAVNLSSTAGRTLASFKMDMQSFACQTGHWNGNPDDPSNTVEPCGNGDNVTPPGVSPGTFQWPVTANIYAVNGDGSPGALLATSGPVTQTIPYRPAHDTTGHCTNLDNNGGSPPVPNSDSGNRWWNPAALGGAGACQSSIATVLSFNFPAGITLPDQVIWTVSFATTSEGTTVSPAQGVQACSTGPDLRFPGLTDGGCPYDSLNPGDNGNTGGADFPASHITNAPYAGSDVTPGVAYLNQGSGLQSQNGWAGLRPLGEIITSQ
jgi:hypothetical protein